LQVQDVDPAADCEFDGHGRQLLLPSDAEYVPAGQLMHVAMEVAPMIGEYLPAAHPMHENEPVPVVY
jgi:hypothetical protein